ncbi:4-phosphoerythronate dehydrogenase [Spirochaetota bacterium]
MRIFADENIPFAKEAFSTLGSVVRFRGREIVRTDLLDADILIVRSITKVNKKLLFKTPVKFVGTATIGTDHVDEAYLRKNNIAFTSAPGCNSNSVSEYVIAALVKHMSEHAIDPKSRTIGVIGCGNVGSKVVKKCRGLGMKVIMNDPPLYDKTGKDTYKPLKDIFQAADVVTLHVPLNRSGKYKSLCMADSSFFNLFKKNILFINTSRGSVTDEKALRAALKTGTVTEAILDVWENEPGIDERMLEKAYIASPHIAGYSMNGKINGTTMIYTALCKFLCIKPSWAVDYTKLGAYRKYSFTKKGSFTDSLYSIIRKNYDIMKDNSALKKFLAMNKTERGKYFDMQRKKYRTRWEFMYTTLTLHGFNKKEIDIIEKLGFNTGTDR